VRCFVAVDARKLRDTDSTRPHLMQAACGAGFCAVFLVRTVFKAR
jgi:hypothetical protein